MYYIIRRRLHYKLFNAFDFIIVGVFIVVFSFLLLKISFDGESLVLVSGGKIFFKFLFTFEFFSFPKK